MKRIVTIVLIASATFLGSCSKETAIAPKATATSTTEPATVVNQPAGNNGSTPKGIQPLGSWSYYSSASFGNAFGVPQYFCYDAHGTNQSANRMVVTVSNSSAPSLTCTIIIASGSCSTELTSFVQSPVVSPYLNRSYIFDVSGYSATWTNIRVKIQPNTASAYSGTVLVGWEY